MYSILFLFLGRVETVTSKFDFISLAARRALKCKKALPRKKNMFPCNRWYDEECRQVRKSLNVACRGNDSDEQKHYDRCRKQYKTLVRKKQRNHQQEIVHRLQNSHKSEYMWTILKDNAPKRKAEIPVSVDAFTSKFENRENMCDCDYFDVKI